MADISSKAPPRGDSGLEVARCRRETTLHPPVWSLRATVALPARTPCWLFDESILLVKATTMEPHCPSARHEKDL